MSVIRVRRAEKKGDWFITVNGRLVRHYASKQEAIDAAKDFAKEWGSEVMVDGIDGQIYRHSAAVETAKEDRIRSVIREVSNLPDSFGVSISNQDSGGQASGSVRRRGVSSHTSHAQGLKAHSHKKG